MRTLTILLVILLLAPGCALFEDAGKLATTAAVAALKAELPALTHSILDEAKILADKGVVEATTAAAEQAVKAGQLGLMLVARKADVDPGGFDFDADGKLDDGELGAMVAEVNRKAKEEPENVPWWIQALSAVGALGGTLAGVAGGNRYLQSRRKEQVKAEVKKRVKA